MISHNPAPGKCGGCQPSNIGQSFSVAAGFALRGHPLTDKDDKLATLSVIHLNPNDRVRSSSRRGEVAHQCQSDASAQGETTLFPVVMTAMPRAGVAGLMDPNPVVVTVFPLDGAYHVSNT